MNEVFFPGRATDSKTLAILRAAWRDLAAHWRQPKRAASSLWPLWLGFAVLAFALLASVSLAFDATEARAAAQLDPRLVGFFEIVTQAGKSNWLFALSILTLAYALYRHALEQNRRLRARFGLLASQALYFVTVQSVSGILSQVVKHLVGRARPKLIDTLGPQHFDLFSAKAVLASFPSGHTTTVFAAAASLIFFLPSKSRWWATPLLLSLALLVAASRLIIGAHYPSDVLGGAILGAGSALAVARVFARRKIAFTLRGDELLPKPRGKEFWAKSQA
ncbi:MAG: phosphatase PAP2 family protein [Rhodoblastus sp.]|uniref:phosphatase PAP2 family protein n=3 Tax=Rhodoblastus sp. TaxID=1962975 RepID=UPI003F99BAAF